MSDNKDAMRQKWRDAEENPGQKIPVGSLVVCDFCDDEAAAIITAPEILFGEVPEADITPDAVAEVGRALFGAQWQTPLADELDIRRDTLVKYMTGKRRVPGWLPAKLVAICEERSGRLTMIAQDIRRAAKDGNGAGAGNRDSVGPGRHR